MWIPGAALGSFRGRLTLARGLPDKAPGMPLAVRVPVVGNSMTRRLLTAIHHRFARTRPIPPLRVRG